MKLNHINLPVTDVTAAVTFFEHYFGFQCVSVKGDAIIAVLENETAFVLVLMKAKEPVHFPGAFHIGFLQETNEAVDLLFKQLQAEKTLELRAPGKIRDTYGFYFYFDGIFIEVSRNLS